MVKKVWRMAAVVVVLGFTQAAVASFCPFSSSKKSQRPPMQRPVYPVMAWVPAQLASQQMIGGQQMVLVPVYPLPRTAMPRIPRYSGFTR